jgi:hypothetical protein
VGRSWNDDEKRSRVECDCLGGNRADCSLRRSKENTACLVQTLLLLEASILGPTRLMRPLTERTNILAKSRTSHDGHMEDGNGPSGL